MEEFCIQNEHDYIKVIFENVPGFPGSTTFKGGYDVEARLEISIRSFKVLSRVWLYTGGIYKFYEDLKRCQESISGIAEYADPYEPYFNYVLSYTELGQVIITGYFSDTANEFRFNFNTDQTFINPLLDSLKIISDKYGG